MSKTKGGKKRAYKMAGPPRGGLSATKQYKIWMAGQRKLGNTNNARGDMHQPGNGGIKSPGDLERAGLKTW